MNGRHVSTRIVTLADLGLANAPLAQTASAANFLKDVFDPESDAPNAGC